MSGGGEPDRFEVVSGPEDGTEFHITRTPFTIGTDASCGIALRLDQEVRRQHARVTVVAEGYRVRRVGNGAVWVNGRRAGYVLSRIVRNGGIVRVGGTDLYFAAAPEGLASRSYGMPHESDTGWAVRFLFRRVTLVLRGTYRYIQELFGNSLKLIVGFIILIVAIEYFWPGILREAKDAAIGVWYSARGLITRFTGY